MGFSYCTYRHVRALFVDGLRLATNSPVRDSDVVAARFFANMENFVNGLSAPEGLPFAIVTLTAAQRKGRRQFKNRSFDRHTKLFAQLVIVGGSYYGKVIT